MRAQSEINASGGSASGNLIVIDWNITSGLQELYASGSEFIKLGTLQPFLQEKTTSDSLTIYNFVTANKDGKNDFFLIEGIQDSKPQELTIFNRLGNIVFHTTDYKNNWDGTDLEVGSYFYVFKYDSREFKNSIFLSR